MAVTTTNLGVITAYGDAVAAGYTGTKAEWQALMASYATVGQQAVDAKNDAVAAKNTAVSKATEATTAASTATTKASEASASAQSIAQSAAQIQENTDSIDQLMSDLTKHYPINPIDTSFFKDLNYAAPYNVEFKTGVYCDVNGKIAAGSNTNSLVIKVKPNTTYYFYAPSRNRQIVVESADDFVVGSTYTQPTVSYYSTYNSTPVITFTTGATAKKVFIYFYSGSYDYEANKNNIVMTEGDFYAFINPVLQDGIIPDVANIAPKDTTFFERINYFNEKTATLFTERFVNSAGKIAPENAGAGTLVIPVDSNTTYWFYAPSMNRNFVAESADNNFKIGTTHTLLSAGASSSAFSFTTGATAKYVAIYFSSTAYDYEANKNGIVLNKNEYFGVNAVPFIPYKHLPDDLASVLDGAKILIFGDSITTTCNITIDTENQTSAYSWRNPSNSYVNAGGTTVQFSMWPKILKLSEPCGEIRNYAESGASYKTSTRESGYERQNLQYQIDVAMNDLDNPNDVFEVDNYVPDIVIFALGTNDGAPNDTYDSAMAKLVFESDGKTINVTSTITTLDDTKFFESAMKAYLRIKQAFPMAQIFCVLPIQRADSAGDGTLHDGLKKIAQRYGCIIIDGAFDSGITREFNVWDGLGTYLKDGLHPNEKGQNLMARMIISALKAHYMPFGIGFN